MKAAATKQKEMLNEEIPRRAERSGLVFVQHYNLIYSVDVEFFTVSIREYSDFRKNAGYDVEIFLELANDLLML